MNTNTVLIIVTVVALAGAFIAYQAYEAQQNSLGGILGKALGSLI